MQTLHKRSQSITCPAMSLSEIHDRTITCKQPNDPSYRPKALRIRVGHSERTKRRSSERSNSTNLNLPPLFRVHFKRLTKYTIEDTHYGAIFIFHMRCESATYAFSSHSLFQGKHASVSYVMIIYKGVPNVVQVSIFTKMIDYFVWEVADCVPAHKHRKIRQAK